MLKHEIISHVGELPVFFNYYKRSNDLIPSHWHKHLEVLLITQGSMVIDAGNRNSTLQPGDLYIINPETIHQTLINDTTSVLLLQIPYELLDQSVPQMKETLFREHLPLSDYGNDPNFKAMSQCLYEMRDIFAAKEKGYAFLFNSVLHRFLYLIYRHFSTQANPASLPVSDRSRDHLQKATIYINQHYKEAISLKEIASHLALNPEYFCRMFKKHMGVTFLNYINQVRLVHIYKDLQKTKDPIKIIQERHGFTNYKVFKRMFLESYGCLPSEIRRS